MVSPEEYLKAIDTIREYNKQIPSSLELTDLVRGHYVECVRVHNQSIKCLTLGKRYKAIIVDRMTQTWRFTIRDDNGSMKTYKVTNTQFKHAQSW